MLACSKFAVSGRVGLLMVIVAGGCGGGSAGPGSSGGASAGGAGVTGGAPGSGGAIGSGGASSGSSGGAPGSGGASSGGAPGSGGGSAGGAAGGNTATGGRGGGGTASGGAGGGASTAFKLTSPTLMEGGMFPADATCETTKTASQMPGLMWTGAPANTKSFAMAFVDTTLIPGNTNGYHSVMWDIPVTVSMLPEGLPAGSPPMGVVGLEAVKQKKAPSGAAWLGPCPNFGSTMRTKTDTYEFRLYALDVATLPSNLTSMTVLNLIKAIEALPPLGTAVLSGRSNAAGSMLK